MHPRKQAFGYTTYLFSGPLFEWMGVSWVVKKDGEIRLTQARINWGHPLNEQPSEAELTPELQTLLYNSGAAYDYY